MISRSSKHRCDEQQPQTLDSVSVSIIMPLHNAEQFITEAIKSVIAQTYQHWELIVVDDASNDRSAQIVEDLAHKDSRIVFIRLRQNSGAAVARNAAIERAKGRFIAFLDSDDTWMANKLGEQIGFMLNAGCPFSFHAYERMDENGQATGIVGVPEKVNYQQMLMTSVIGCLTAIYDTAYFGKVYMPLIRKRQDYGLWLKLLKQTQYAYGIQVPLARYRVRRGGISYNKLNTSLYTWQVYRRVENLSFLTSAYYFANYSVRGALRSKFPFLARKLKVMEE